MRVSSAELSQICGQCGCVYLDEVAKAVCCVRENGGCPVVLRDSGDVYEHQTRLETG